MWKREIKSLITRSTKIYWQTLIKLMKNLIPLLTPVVSDFALNTDGDKNPWARVSVGLSNMNLTSGQAYY